MPLTGSQAQFLAKMTDGAWGGELGSVVFAGENRRYDMVGIRVLKEITKPTGDGPMVNMMLAGPLGGMMDSVLMTPDQAEELATRLQELAGRARQLRRA